MFEFQFTPLREGQPTDDPENPDLVKFQFTPLREGQHMRYPLIIFVIVFQFTPLREGQRPMYCSASADICISIHAPA